MTKIQPSRYIMEQILDGVAKLSPFDKVGGQSFLKFDRISFDTSKQRIAFWFEDKEVFYVDFSKSNADANTTVTIDGIEGRMRFFTNI